MSKSKSKKRKDFELQLGGHVIRVKWVDGLGDMAEAYGRWDEENDLIELDPEQSETQAVETLIHECVHACSSRFGLDLDENRVRLLGVGLQQLLAPFLVKEL